MKIKKEQKEKSISYLKELFTPETTFPDDALKKHRTVYVSVTHISRSGMSRRLKAYVVRDGGMENITWHVANVLEYPLNDKGIRVDGCGMDMTFHLVYTLSYALFNDPRDKEVRAGYVLSKENIN